MNDSLHLSSQFDEDLSRLRTAVLQMGGLVEAQVTKALDGLRSGDIELLEAVIQGDKEVNLAQIKLDDAAYGALEGLVTSDEFDGDPEGAVDAWIADHTDAFPGLLAE